MGGDVIGLEDIAEPIDAERSRRRREPESWARLVEDADVRRMNTSIPERASLEVEASISWMLLEHPTLGKLLQPVADEKCTLSRANLLMSPMRRSVYSRVAEICHR